MKTRVLFLCVHNSVRSQMAEGFLRHLYGDRYIALSAGITSTQVNAYAIKVMAEVGIDISQHRSKSFSEFLDTSLDIVISTCDEAQKACAFLPAKKVLHWGFRYPGLVKKDKEILILFRQVRDAIRNRIEDAVKYNEI